MYTNHIKVYIMPRSLSRYIKTKNIDTDINTVDVILAADLPLINLVPPGTEYILRDKNNQIVKSNGVEWVNVGGDSMEIGDVIQSAATEHNGFGLVSITNTAYVDAGTCPALAKLFNYQKPVMNKPNIPLGLQTYDWNECTSLIYIDGASYCSTDTGTLYKTVDGKNWEIKCNSFPGKIKRGQPGQQLPWMIPVLEQGVGTKFITWDANQLYISQDSGATWSASGNTTTSNLLDDNILDINYPVNGANSKTGTPWILQSAFPVSGNSFEYNIVQVTSATTSTKSTITIPSTYTINCIGSSQQVPPSWISPTDTQDDFLFIGGNDYINNARHPIIYIKNLRTGTWSTKYLTDSISEDIISIHYTS